MVAVVLAQGQVGVAGAGAALEKRSSGMVGPSRSVRTGSAVMESEVEDMRGKGSDETPLVRPVAKAKRQFEAPEDQGEV